MATRHARSLRLAAASEAERLFDAFLAALERGEVRDFASFVAGHGEHALALHRLHEQWRRLESSMETALPGPFPAESFFGREASTGEPDATRRAHRPGDVLGDYRLVHLLGQGAMGEVWEAQQISLGRRVALKLLRPEEETPGRVRQLGCEARAGGRLDHPGIVTVYAAGEVDGVPYIAQQLVGDGFTLADFIGRMRDRPPHSAAYDRHLAGLFRDVALAVHAANEAGILHRDLKPRNILIGTDGRPKVSDFGLAYVSSEASAARPGLVGTCAYMSPEQVAGRDIVIDRRTDVFSLGAVLYEALTLRRAFEGDSAPQVLQRVVHEDPPDPRTVRARVPPDLAVICLKALEKDRANRYPDMRGLADDLGRFLAHEPIRAVPPGPVLRARKWVLRNPVWSTAFGLVSAALVVISLLLMREFDLRRHADAERDRADRNAQAAASSERLATARAADALRQSYLANIRAAATHLDRGEHAEARRRLAACAVDLRGWEWSHYALRADTSVATLRGHEGSVTSVASTPDGRRIVTGSLDGTVRLWDTESGRSLAVFSGHEGAVRSVAIAHERHTIVSGSDDRTVRVWDGATGRQLYILQGHEAPVRAVAISRDGWSIVSGSEDGTARLWDGRAGKDVIVRPRFKAGVVSVALSADGRRMVTGSRYGTVRVWDARTARLLMELPWDNQGEVAVAIDGTGSRIASGGRDGTIHVWDGLANELLRTLPGDGHRVRSLALTGNGARLVSASAGDVRVWDTRSGEIVDALTGHEGSVTSVAVSRDGSHIVAGCTDETAILWDAKAARAEAVLVEDLPYPPTSLALSRDGMLIVTAAIQEHVVRLWNGATGAPLDVLRGHQQGVTGVALSASGHRIASVSYDQTVRVWNGRSGEELAVRAGHAGGTSSVAMDTAGDVVVSGSHDGTVNIWWPKKDEALVVTVPGIRCVSSVAVSADGRVVAAGSTDGTVFVWDGKSRVLRQGEGLDDGLLALSADGRFLARAAVREDIVTIWDTGSGDVRAVLRGLRSGLVSLDVNRDGSRVVAASTGDCTLKLWDGTLAETLAVLAGHTAPVTAVAISGDERRIVSASADGTLRAWDTRHDLAPQR